MRTFKRIVLPILLGSWFGLSQPLCAQDQTVVISQPSVVLEDLSPIADAARASLCPKNLKIHECETNAATLIREIVKSAPEPNTYYIIHIVRYQDDQLAVDQQNWYVYYKDWAQKQNLWDHLVDPRLDHHFQETRIYGSHNVALVYVHLNVPATDKNTVRSEARSQSIQQLAASRPDNADQAGTTQESTYKSSLLDEIKADAANLKRLVPNDPLSQLKVDQSWSNRSLDQLEGSVADLRTELLIVKVFENQPASGNLALQSTSGHNFAVATPGSDYAVDDRFVPISYKISVTKKLPAPLQNLQGIIGIVAHGQPSAIKVKAQYIALTTGKAFTVEPLPSDMNVSALNGAGDQQKELSKLTFDNEKKYWYDFSFAFPVNSLKQLSYDTSNNTVTARTVTKQNLFAVADISLPFDTKKAQYQLIPVLLYGVPITGKPLDRHLLALAIGLNKLQVFAGITFNRTNVPRTLAAGQTATPNQLNSDLHDRWVRKLSVGINLPVGTVVNLLKGSK